jgi:hypothetical protein
VHVSWCDAASEDVSDEIVLANTFLNSVAQPPVAVQEAGGRGRDRTMKPAGVRRPRLSWIDDPKRRAPPDRPKVEVPISPYSRRPTPERPPTHSYNSLEVGPGWVDTLEGKAGAPYNGYVVHHHKVRGGVTATRCSASHGCAGLPSASVRCARCRSHTRRCCCFRTRTRHRRC